MKTEYEYEIEIFELDPNSDEIELTLLIKNVLNSKGRERYSIVSVNEFGGFRSPKKIIYTLMREKKEYDPFEEPHFMETQRLENLRKPSPFETKPSPMPPNSQGVTFRSKANTYPLPNADSPEPDF
jgi:hypothetical protein